jgi:hypothetical protein
MVLSATRGQFRIVQETGPRNIESEPRTRASTFSPSGSTNRLGITDSGTHYLVRLVDGVPYLSTDNGVSWQPLAPELDPWTQTMPPWGISFQNSRRGEALKPLKFDMIASGRGRVLAKEAGTDRIFQLALDELFRTSDVSDDVDWQTQRVNGKPLDPPVPPNHIKLDPEFFLDEDNRSDAFVPLGLLRRYAEHPAAERFPLFAEAMRSGQFDFMPVIVMPRVWELVESRPPLQIIDLADIMQVNDDILKAKMTELRLRGIFDALSRSPSGNASEFLNEFADFFGDWIHQRLNNLLPGSFALPFNIRNSLNSAIDLIDVVSDLTNSIEDVPLIGDVASDILTNITSLKTLVSSLEEDLTATIEQEISDVARQINQHLSTALGAIMIDFAAYYAHRKIENNGFSALVLPLYIGLGFMALQMVEAGIIEAVDDPDGSISRSKLIINLGMAKQFLAQQNFPQIKKLVDLIIDDAHATRTNLPPGAPPSHLPTYTHVVYQRRPINGIQNSPSRRHVRLSIDFDKILDIGMGTIHWSEHWQSEYGCEIQSLLGKRPIVQGVQYSLTQYQFLNGPVIDGDGWQDGTTNFYMLVRLQAPDTCKTDQKNDAGKEAILYPVRPDRIKDCDPPTPKPQKYAILYHDEQTYFTQRWRLIHPTKDVEGDLISLARHLADNPAWFNFDLEKYWCPLEADCVDDRSRMLVSRQIIALTGLHPDKNDPVIFTITFAYGICDHSWRWRKLPMVASLDYLDSGEMKELDKLPGKNAETLFVNSLGLRDDGLLHLRGWCIDPISGKLLEARWFQRYLPADCRHTPAAHELQKSVMPDRPYEHGWDVISESAYRRAEAYFVFGAYEPVVNSRVQYYTVDILSDKYSNTLSPQEIEAITWINALNNDDKEIERFDNGVLKHHTINLNWNVRPDSNRIPVSELAIDRRTRHSLSMYERVARFRLLNRGSRGWIAIFADKRDDDLKEASHLPQLVRLSPDVPGRAQDDPAEYMNILFKSNRRVTRGPVVEKVVIKQYASDRGGLPTGLEVNFWTSLTADEVAESLWRFSVAAIDDEGNRIFLVRTNIAGTFIRLGQPSQALPAGFKLNDVLQSEYQYQAVFHDLPEQDIQRFCSKSGRFHYGTSAWFEDIVGHMGTPQILEFDT